MKFLADMGVSLGVVDWLRRQGHDAKHLRDERLQRAADLDVFTKAIADERVVLTFDLDFGEIAEDAPAILGLILREAIEARNGWKRILARCAARPTQRKVAVTA